ncbi:MAG: Integral membrane protein MviN [Parcubacteria group bacterium Gr01-1014_33]|nr:MAG: Integral membrane protein MviN [Parcubacteria group bacterium Gr01-1014_33]
MSRLNPLNHGIANIHAAALLLGAAGLLSRILGMLRDRLLASQFGAGRELDIYYAAFQIPDFLYVLFLLGAASSAILPLFQETLARDPEEARSFVSQLATLFFIGAAGMAIAAFFLAPFLMRALVPGFSESERIATVTLTRIMLLSPIFFGISGILSSVVESFQRFFAYALSSILYNLGIMVGIVAFLPVFGFAGLGIGVAFGALLNFLVLFFPVRTLGFAPMPVWGKMQKNVKRVLFISLPRVLSVSLSQLTLMALVALGSVLAPGSISVFALAQNLYFVPIGIFGTSYAVPLFPRLNRAAIEKEGELFFREFFFGMRAILFWVIPSVALFLVLRAHIVRVGLGGGIFSWEDTRLTAAMLAVLICGLGAGSILLLLIKGFYAIGETWAPFFINIGASLMSIASAFSLVRLMGTDAPLAGVISGLLRVGDLASAQVLGLGIGYAIGVLANGIGLYFVLMARARKKFGGTHPQFPWTALLKIGIAALGAGVVTYGVRVSFSETLPLITFFQVFLQGALSGLAGMGTYFAILLLLKSEDVAAFLHSLQKRLLKIKVLPKGWSGEEIK